VGVAALGPLTIACPSYSAPMSLLLLLRCTAVHDPIHFLHTCSQVGKHLLGLLRALQGKHDIIGDVRGAGLMLGVELVKDRGTKARSGHAPLTLCLIICLVH